VNKGKHNRKKEKDQKEIIIFWCVTTNNFAKVQEAMSKAALKNYRKESMS
jgi:hypothetical protein